MRTKLARTMTATLLLVSSATLLVVAGIYYVSAQATLTNIESHLHAAIQAKGTNLVATQALGLRDLVTDNAFGDVGRLVERTLEQDDQVVYGLFLGDNSKPWAFAARGQSAGSQAPRDWTSVGIEPGALRPTKTQATTRRIFNEPAYDFATPVVSDSGEYLGSLHYALSDRSLQLALGDARRSSQRALATIIGLLIVLGGMAIVLGTMLSRRAASRITQPVRELTKAAETFAAGGRDIRVAIDSGDELEVLGAAFNKMVAEITEAQGHLEQMNHVLETKVEQRTRALGIRNRDMRLVLDNVDQGFLTLSVGGELAQERSAIVDRWFGPYGEGATFSEYFARIDPVYAEMFSLGYEALLDDVLPRELCLHQLPTRIRHDGREFQCTYFPIVQDDKLGGLLVVINDITAAVRAAQHAAEREEVVALFDAVSRDRGSVVAFFDEANQYVTDMPTASLEVQKRLVHTLKGNCSLMGFCVLATLCHELEDVMAELHLPLGRGACEALESRWRAFTKVFDTFMGDKRREAVELSIQDLQDLEQDIAHGASQAEVRDRLASWRMESAEKPLARLGNHARSLAARLGKGDLDVVIDPGGARLMPQAWTPIWSNLLHVVRNAIDHGIEPPAVRLQGGKPVRPRLRLATAIRGGMLAIEIEDDGAGIDWAGVERAAVRRGLPHQSEADLVRAIFSSEVTTRANVTATSGRGVGLAAVAQQVEATGGSVTVSSRSGEGTCFKFSFPLPKPGAAPFNERLAQQTKGAGAVA